MADDTTSIRVEEGILSEADTAQQKGNVIADDIPPTNDAVNKESDPTAADVHEENEDEASEPAVDIEQEIQKTTLVQNDEAIADSPVLTEDVVAVAEVNVNEEAVDPIADTEPAQNDDAVLEESNDLNSKIDKTDIPAESNIDADDDDLVETEQALDVVDDVDAVPEPIPDAAPLDDADAEPITEPAPEPVPTEYVEPEPIAVDEVHEKAVDEDAVDEQLDQIQERTEPVDESPTKSEPDPVDDHFDPDAPTTKDISDPTNLPEDETAADSVEKELVDPVEESPITTALRKEDDVEEADVVEKEELNQEASASYEDLMEETPPKSKDIIADHEAVENDEIDTIVKDEVTPSVVAEDEETRNDVDTVPLDVEEQSAEKENPMTSDHSSAEEPAHDLEEESDFEILDADVATEPLTEPKAETFDFEEQMAKYQHDGHDHESEDDHEDEADAEPEHEEQPEDEPQPQPQREPVRVSLTVPQHDDIDDVVNDLELDEPKSAAPPPPQFSPKRAIQQRGQCTGSGASTSRRVQTAEIGVQTIICAVDIKLGSTTKKRIAQELGHYVPPKKGGSMSPIMASKQMRSSSQKIAKIINEHKAELKVMFDRYSNGLTNKIKLDGLTKMLRDRNILKKLSLVPEITKAFHKSSFTAVTPDSLSFDEFLQCIIRLANDLLSRKKKRKYETAESRVSLFLAKLHLRPFPTKDEVDSLRGVVDRDSRRAKTIAQDMSPNIAAAINKHANPMTRDPNAVSMQYDYRLSEKQLDSEFDNYFNTGGFFSDAHSASRNGTPLAPSSAGAIDGDAASHKLAGNEPRGDHRAPISPKFKKGADDRKMKRSPKKAERQDHHREQHRPVPPNRRTSNDSHRMKRGGGGSKRVKASPFSKQQAPKKLLSSYQELYQSTNDPPTQQMTAASQRLDRPELAQRGMEMQQRSPFRGNGDHPHHQQMRSPLRGMQPTNLYKGHSEQHVLQQQRAMRSPNNSANPPPYPQHAGYHPAAVPSQEYSQNPSYDISPQHAAYNEYYDVQQQSMMGQHPQAPMQHDQYNEFERQERELSNQINHLTEQEQRVVRNIHKKQQSQLNRAMPRHRSNSYGRR